MKLTRLFPRTRCIINLGVLCSLLLGLGAARSHLPLHPTRLAIDPGDEELIADAPPSAALQQHYGTVATASALAASGSTGASAAALTSSWHSLGPIGMVDIGAPTPYEPSMGRVNCIAVDPTDGNKLYLGAGSGGVWTSTDGGQNWTPRTDNLPVLGVTDIKLDPQNLGTMYIATGDADGHSTPSVGVYKSTDSGVTWKPTGLIGDATNHPTIYKLAVNLTAAGKIYAATTFGIYISSDGGDHWTSVQPQGSLPGSVTYYDVKLRPDNPAIVYATGSGGSFYRSTDGGTSWAQITSGLPAAGTAERMSVGVTAADGNYVFLLSGTTSSTLDALYKSTDGGLTFTALPANSTLSSAFGRQGYYTNSLAVSPTSPADLYVGGLVPARSSDGGATWNIITGRQVPYTPGATITHVDVHALQFAGSNLYACTDGGVHRTSDGGAHWTNLSQNLVIAQLYRFAQTDQNPSLLFTAEQDNGFNRYLNGKWEHDEIGDYGAGVIDPTNASIVYSSSRGGIQQSTDGGNKFTALPTFTSEQPTFPGAPLALDPNNPTTMFAGYMNLFRSTDSGNSWQQTTNYNDYATCQSIAVAPSDSRVVYAARPYGSGGAHLIRSADSGVTWTVVGAGLPPNPGSIAIDPANANRLWVTVEGSLVYRSVDGGATWSDFSGSLPKTPAHSIVFQRGTSDGLFVGLSAGVYYRDSTMSDWQPYSTGLPNAVVNDLQINYTAGTLRAATYGRGMWETPLPLAGSPGRFANIATRLQILGGDNGLIEGFIITGPADSTKKVLIRGLGPSTGVAGAIADPVLELNGSSVHVANDDWQQGDASQLPAGLSPDNPKESVIVATLAPGEYTAMLRDVQGRVGTGLTEVYDLDSGGAAQMANIATRGLVQTGDNVMIGGFIVGGTESAKVLVRVTGPTLSNYGISGALADPRLELHDSNGGVTRNDNWRDTQEAEIKATGIPPANSNEPAILATLVPGNYTAVVRGANDTTGVAVVEAYNLQ